MNTYFILLLIVCAGILLYMFKKNHTIEGFIPGPCPNCGQRNRLQCSDCASCGWCLTPDGYGECVPGNQKGPFFRQDCLDWQYEPRRFVSRQRPVSAYRRPFWRWRRYWW